MTSGLRIGTPAITTRGFKEGEVTELTGWICDVLEDINNTDTQGDVREKVIALCSRFPVYEVS